MSEEDSNSVLVLLLKVLLVPMAFFLRGFTVQKLWLWFAVPALGVKPLGFALAYGLALLSAYMVSPMPDHVGVKEAEDAATVKALCTIVVPLITLGIGYLVSLYV